jgi:hypothetical protein
MAEKKGRGMRKFLVAIVCIFCCTILFHPSADAVLINYDGTGNSDLTQILGYYSGLDGNPVHSAGFMWLNYASINDIYGPHSLNAMAFAISTNPVWIDWSSDVNSVSLWYGHQVGYPLSVQGYNNGGLVFDSGALPQNSGGMYQYVAPNLDIDRLVFNGSPNWWTYDDLSYNVSQGGVVPEPASLALLGVGILGLFRRRLILLC